MDFKHETSLLHLLHRASQIADGRVMSALGNGLTVRQIVVLAAFAAIEGGSQTDVVAMTGVDRSTLADITRRLLKRGLIARRRRKDDARAYAVRLTDLGQRALKEALPIIAKVEADLTELLPVKRRAELIAALGALALTDRSVA